MSNIIDKLENFGLKILEKIGLKKLANLYRKHQEGMRYLIFGALATLVNIITYTLCAYLIFEEFEEILRVNLSNILAIIVSIIFAYITNKLYVFKSKTENAKELFLEFSKFTSCRIVTAIIDVLLMQLTVVTLCWNDILMKILVNIVVIILNFIFSKLIIFKKNEKN